MKKLILMAVCAIAVMAGCKNKGNTSPNTSEERDDSITADNIVESLDTVAHPMFLGRYQDGGPLQVLYWTEVKMNENADNSKEYVKSWTLQDHFRRNVRRYTNLIVADKTIKVKFVGEVLTDPDGNPATTGIVHSREDIPAMSAIFDVVNAKDSRIAHTGGIIVTDEFLQSHKLLPYTAQHFDYGKEKPLANKVVNQLENQYGMKAARSALLGTVGDTISYGLVQFKGEWKGAPKDKDNPDRKYCLALDVLIQGERVSINEQKGYYESDDDYGWNVDDDGTYSGCPLMAVFDGPEGQELYWEHYAPESYTIGMFQQQGDRLVENEYEGYYMAVDEEIPVWKKDFAEMKRLFEADNPENKNISLTKWAHVYMNDGYEWLWLRSQDDKDGAFFIRKDGKFRLVATEAPKLKPSKARKDGITYLYISGSAGGPSYYTQVFAYKNGQQTEHFTCMEVYGEIAECTLNGKTLTNEEGKAYKDALPQGEKIEAWFK